MGQAWHAATILAVLAATSCHTADNTAPPEPTQLAFLGSPNTTTVGSTIKPAVAVAIKDVEGNTVIGATNAVTLVLGSNPAGAALLGTTTVNAVNGVATFADLSISKAAAQYALTATSGDLASATSAAFSVTGPSKLAFVVPPSATMVGVAMQPAVQVTIQDSLGNAVPGATNAVTVTLGSNPTGATLLGTTTVNAVSGVATFSDLSIDKPSAGYALTASSVDLTPASSASFTIAPGPSALYITTTTTGTNLPANYNLYIDCDSYGCRYNAPIGTKDAVVVPVAGGDHLVDLAVANNCAVSDSASRTVTVLGATYVSFAVACAATGTLSVTTTTGGTDIYPDGYSVCVDRSGDSCARLASARPNDSISIKGILAGSHTVTLTNVGGNCAVSGGTSHVVTIPGDGGASVRFDATCSLAERIAFSSGGTISLIHSDGTANHIIVQGVAPVWSPDGARLAYECGQDICTINGDGTALAHVTSGGVSSGRATWSPDGLRIAYASRAAGTTDLYVAAASGLAAVRLTRGIGVVGNPAWSPDGTRIAFDCQVDAQNFDICVVNADGTGFARLTNDPGRDSGAAWKQDGSTLAFSMTHFGFDEIALMSPAGGSVTRIGAGLPGFAPTWSPDGTQLAFVQLFNDPYYGPYEVIVTAGVDGSGLRTVTRGTEPAWRPHR